MRLIFTRLLLMILLLPLLCSCSDSGKKETAYCFSAVFENSDGISRITLYCKTPTSDKSEGESDGNTSLTFEGRSFYDAFENIDGSEQEIYFDSLCAVYVADNVTDGQVLDIACAFLGNTAYNTSFSVYLPSSKAMTTAEILRKSAEEVCKNEGIPKTSQKDYVKAIEYFRKRSFGGGTV